MPNKSVTGSYWQGVIGLDYNYSLMAAQNKHLSFRDNGGIDMRKIDQRQKDQRDKFETGGEREERENREIDAYHQEIETEIPNKVYIRTEYLN